MSKARAIVDAAHQMAESASQAKLQKECIYSDLRDTIRITTTEVIVFYLMPEVFSKLLLQQHENPIELAAANAETDLLWREADIPLPCFRPT